MGPKRNRAKREKLAMVVITVFMWGAGLYYLGYVARDYAIAKASVPTECTIVSSTVRRDVNTEDGPDRYAAEVVVSYEADGRRYQTTDHGPYHSHPVDGRVKAEAQARGLQPGQVVPCLRVGGVPSLATIFGRDLGSGDFLAHFYFGIAFMLIPIVVLVAGRLKRRKQA